MAARVRMKQVGTLENVAKSDELSAQLEPIADAVLNSASNDPNEYFVSTLRKQRFIRPGRRGRTTWQIGAAPGVGERVEAKRGTLSRALGEAGV
jgi:hypothetical protein